jgi:CPA2 family monovalent cation:H+ antiporter-2
LAVGLGLFQVGEFSFVLARVGLEAQAIDQNLYSLVLAVSVLSMMATPLASAMTAPLHAFKRRFSSPEPLQTENLPSRELTDHVVIAGGGRVGQHIARILSELSVPCVIVELNHQRMLECKAANFPVIYGDMSQPTAIEAAHVATAKLLLITTPSVVVSQAIVRQAHRLNPDLHIVARAEGVAQTRQLYENGVYMVVLPEMEAGLEIARQALLHLEIPVPVIQQYTDEIRQQMYAPMYSQQNYQLLTRLNTIKNLLEISWVEIGPKSFLIGTSIKEAAVRTRTGASVVGVMHEKEFHTNPKVEYCFAKGDLIAVVGNKQERLAFKKMAETEEKQLPPNIAVEKKP